jgi:hypothetical protein
MRSLTGWVAVAVGMAATAASATAGLSLLGRHLHSESWADGGVVVAKLCGPGEVPRKAEDDARPRKRITIGPTRLCYFEDDNVLQLYLEMTSRYDIVYVPTARRWPERMPAWAQHRRDDIMVEIKRLAGNHPIRWVDDDT